MAYIVFLFSITGSVVWFWVILALSRMVFCSKGDYIACPGDNILGILFPLIGLVIGVLVSYKVLKSNFLKK